MSVRPSKTNFSWHNSDGLRQTSDKLAQIWSVYDARRAASYWFIGFEYCYFHLFCIMVCLTPLLCSLYASTAHCILQCSFVHTYFLSTEKTATEADEPEALANSIETLVTSIKRRSQRLYRDTDGSKARSKLRNKMRRETGILTSVVEQYNSMVPDTQSLNMDTILSLDTAWPWQLTDCGVYTSL